MNLRMRFEVTSEHRRNGAAVRTDWAAYWSRVEMVAKMQFKVVFILRHKRARCSGTLEDALQANVSPHVIIEQLLSTTSYILVASVTKYY